LVLKIARSTTKQQGQDIAGQTSAIR